MRPDETPEKAQWEDWLYSDTDEPPPPWQSLGEVYDLFEAALDMQLDDTFPLDLVNVDTTWANPAVLKARKEAIDRLNSGDWSFINREYFDQALLEAKEEKEPYDIPEALIEHYSSKLTYRNFLDPKSFLDRRKSNEQ